MTIGPGEYFVVHYKFPKIEIKVSKEEMSRGLTIQMPGGQGSVIFSPSEVKEVAKIKIKVSTTTALVHLQVQVHVVQLFYLRFKSVVIYAFI